MNTIRNLRSIAILVASLLVAANIQAQPFGQWDFNAGNLTPTVGAPLTYADGAGGATSLATTFNTTTGFGIPNINGTNASVMRFPGSTNGMGFLMPTPAANGRGSFVDNYTVILDVLFAAESNAKLRPVLETDDGFVVPGADLGVTAANGMGIIGLTSFGTINSNTWYRIGFVVRTNEASMYIDGNLVGSQTVSAAQADRLVLNPSATALLLANTGAGLAAPGYVNSIQLRNTALGVGQMAAIGPASAAGIPTTIPQVPSFISSRTPGSGATGVAPKPTITVVLDQGDTTVNSGSIVLKLDGATVGTMTPTPPTFTVNYNVPTILDPLSVHSLSLTWTDSVVGAKTNTWSFTVQPYQIVSLPAPFYFENFDGVAETAFPTGWYETNNTQTDVAGPNLSNPKSDSYKSWVVITTNTLNTAKGANPLFVPPILVNGSLLTSIANDKLCYAESDSRSGSQVQMLFATNINCLGRSNVFLSFHSIYAQNQDNIASVEYSVDRGANWLPALYMLNDRPDAPDIIRTNGVIDVGATFYTARADQAYGSNFATYIGAPVTTALIPFISGRIDDDLRESIRVELLRLVQADNKSNVWLRFMQAGTASWWFGIDDVGLYEVNTPTFTTQPANKTIAAGTATTFTVVVSSPSAITYQWQHAGTNIADGGNYSGVNTATLTVSNASTNEGGAYKVKATNSSGSTDSSTANLAVVAAPTFTPPAPAPATLQPISVLVSDGYPASFSGFAFGAAPITYEWRLNGAPVGTGTNYSIPSAHAANAGDYTLVAANSFGSVTSLVARLGVVTVPVTSNLVVHLKFDSDYTDASGRGNHATPINGPALVAGKIGNALQFTTSRGVIPVVTNFATLGYPVDLQFGSTNDFSISLWVQYTNQSDDLALISNSQWDSGSNPGWGIFSQGNGGFRVKVSDTVNLTANTGGVGPIIRGNGWHHILVSFQQRGAMYTMYDGALVRTTAWTLTNSVDTSGFNYQRTITNNPNFGGPHAINIGQDGTGWYNDKDGGAITNGMIDDVGIWRRAVSPQEALAIYNGGQAGLNLAQIAQPATAGILTVTRSGGNVNFSWVGGTGIRLQKSSSLRPVTWADVPGTLGLSSYSEPAIGNAYFRLFKP